MAQLPSRTLAPLTVKALEVRLGNALPDGLFGIDLHVLSHRLGLHLEPLLGVRGEQRQVHRVRTPLGTLDRRS